MDFSEKNPFFTAEQIEALNRQPDPAELRQLKNTSYLTGNNIISKLNHILGQGMWSSASRHIETRITSGSRTKFRDGTRQCVEIHYASVVLEVTLTIHARDGSGRNLIFCEPGVGDGECESGQNISVAIEKAATTAATNGLKRCARLLGPALGLGLSSDQPGSNPGVMVSRTNAPSPHPTRSDSPAVGYQPGQTDTPASGRHNPAPTPSPQKTHPTTPTSAPAAAKPADSKTVTAKVQSPEEDLTSWDLNIEPRTLEEQQRFARALRAIIISAPTARHLKATLNSRRKIIQALPRDYGEFLLRTANHRLANLNQDPMPADFLEKHTRAGTTAEPCTAS